MPFVLSLLNLTIALFASCMIWIVDRQSISLSKVFFLCCIIFFAVFPRIEFSEQIVYWRGGRSVFDYYQLTSIYCLIGMAFFAIFYLFKRSKRPLNGRPNDVRLRQNVSQFVIIGLSTVAVMTIYFINDFSMTNVFFRDEEGAINLPSSLVLVYQTFFRPLPSLCLIIYLLLGARKWSVIIVLLVLMLVGNPITGFARWQGAMLYLAALLAAFPQLSRQQNSVVLLLSSGLVLVFPLLDLFRRSTQTAYLKFSFDWIYAGHFDSFQNFARAVEIEYVTWGEQLWGVLLFFVPRQIWEGKPVSSSVELAARSGLSWDNISLNYFGEGYVNFSIFGIPLFAAVLGAFCGWLDRQDFAEPGLEPTRKVFMLLFLGGLVFVFRGALLSAFAYMVGTFLSTFLVYRLAVGRISVGR